MQAEQEQSESQRVSHTEEWTGRAVKSVTGRNGGGEQQGVGLKGKYFFPQMTAMGDRALPTGITGTTPSCPTLKAEQKPEQESAKSPHPNKLAEYTLRSKRTWSFFPKPGCQFCQHTAKNFHVLTSTGTQQGFCHHWEFSGILCFRS